MSPRLKKYTRERTKAPAIILQERDLKILEMVHEYRFLRSDQIAALVQKDGVKLRTNQVILKRLQKLFHNGQLDRPRDQIRYDMMGTDKMIYALANGGADVLAEKRGIDRGKIEWSKKNREVKRPHLWHVMIVSQFRACLALALKKRKDAELLFWRQGDEIRDFVKVEDKKGKESRRAVWPDGFFGLNTPRGRIYFFLEADRSTMINARFLDKMRRYWAYWQKKGHTEKYGIKYFRVLTITRSEQRKKNLRMATKKADSKQKGSNMFMFACEKSYGLKEPERILQAIWQTPAGEEGESLLD